MVSKSIVCLNDQPNEPNEVEECGWVPGELKSVLGYQDTLVSLLLRGTGVSLWPSRYSGQP
jgi:hypothetical protein